MSEFVRKYLFQILVFVNFLITNTCLFDFFMTQYTKRIIPFSRYIPVLL